MFNDSIVITKALAQMDHKLLVRDERTLECGGNKQTRRETSGQNSEKHLNVFGVLCFLSELCRYVGVSYVRNPQDAHCKYTWCWNGYPYTMDCPPGRKVHPYFYWSDKVGKFWEEPRIDVEHEYFRKCSVAIDFVLKQKYICRIHARKRTRRSSVCLVC